MSSPESPSDRRTPQDQRFFIELIAAVDRRISKELERPETIARIAAAVAAELRRGLDQSGSAGAGRSEP